MADRTADLVTEGMGGFILFGLVGMSSMLGDAPVKGRHRAGLSADRRLTAWRLAVAVVLAGSVAVLAAPQRALADPVGMPAAPMDAPAAPADAGAGPVGDLGDPAGAAMGSAGAPAVPAGALASSGGAFASPVGAHAAGADASAYARPGPVDTRAASVASTDMGAAAEYGGMALSIQQALAAADQTNPQLLAARARLRQVDEGVPQALSGWRPHVSLEGRWGPGLYTTNTDPMHDPERRVPQDYELTVTQNLYTSGRVHDSVAQAKLQVLAERATLAGTEAVVLLQAATAYLDTVRDRDILALDRNQETVVARTVTANRTELAAGAITQADLAQSEATLARQRAATSTARAQLAASEAAFEAAVGARPGALVLPPGDFPLPATRAELFAEAAQDNPELGAARYALAASRLGVDLARDQLLPIISINALAEHQREYEYLLANQRANAAQAELQITMPLYQGGAEYSRIRAAKEGNVQAGALVEQADRQARRLIVAGWASLEAARDRVVDADAATRADRVAETGLAQQQAVGARTTIDLLNAEQETLSSMVAAIGARHDVLVAEAVLLAATGRLDAGLLPGAAPYDPAAHYHRVHEQWIGTSPPDDAALTPAVSPEPGPLIDPAGPRSPSRGND